MSLAGGWIALSGCRSDMGVGGQALILMVLSVRLRLEAAAGSSAATTERRGTAGRTALSHINELNRVKVARDDEIDRSRYQP